MLKVGMIGYGGIGHMHLNCWKALSEYAEVVAVADIREEKRNELPTDMHFKVYEDGADLLANEELDVVDICLPTFLHTKFAVAAMEKGCDVFLEKPVCLNEDEAQLLLETQKKTGAKVQIGQVLRFDAPYQYIKDLVETKKYGEIVCAEFHRMSTRPGWSWDNWFQDPDKCGTVALDMHVHDVDFVRYMMGGDPDSLESVATRDKDGVLQQIFTTYMYGNVPITAIGTWDLPKDFGFKPPCYIKFEKALLTITADERKLGIFENDKEPFYPEIKDEYDAELKGDFNISHLGGYYSELKYFITQVIPGTGKEIASLSDCIDSVRLAWKEIEAAGGAKL